MSILALQHNLHHLGPMRVTCVKYGPWGVLALVGVWLWLGGAPIPATVPAALPVAVPAAADVAAVEAQIHRMAEAGAPVVLSRHAKQRMEERGVRLEDIRTVLREGTIRQPPRMGKQGEWSYKLEDEDTRGPLDGEVVVVPRAGSLFIITVMWDGAS